jgi:1-acyl-sn-glycerol-3-phosphate acyltransferase
MQRTIFTTPVVNTFFRWFSIIVMKLAGWKIEGKLPADGMRSVLISAPHTSNWDLPYTLMTAFILRLNTLWLGKESIFKPPFKPLMRWLGGIPVNRDKSTNLVQQAAQLLRSSQEPMQLLVPPEGTRSKARYWKTGFYYIAREAQVPIVLAFMDYSTKRAGLGQVFHPTGDIEKDMEEIKRFYSQFKGKNADQS